MLNNNTTGKYIAIKIPKSFNCKSS